MKVRELIAELQKYDGELNVCKLENTDSFIVEVRQSTINDSDDNKIPVVELVGYTPF